ncbi:MAG: hypothetical protein M3316_09410 [Actinomycetota bacterium]|nr:hypothetical protein [Actinomycetota bacterium]
MSDGARQAPVVSGHQVLSAGFAAATAAFVTSRFGVAGTLLGAALTAMIITGGSAILKAYLESATSNVRRAPRKLQERRKRWNAGRSAEPDTMPGRPDLRDNLAGRMRAALGWFSRLPPLMRRSILVKGLIAAAVAFVIGIGAVYIVERVIGNSLSCGIWAECPEGATPGIKLGGSKGTGANSSLSLGRAKTNVAPGQEALNPAFQQDPSRQDPVQQDPLRQDPVQQDPSRQDPSRQDLLRQDPVQQDPSKQAPSQQAPSFERVDPARQPAPSDNEPARGIFAPDNPVEQDAPAQPGSPSSASPAPREQELPQVERDPARDVAPSDASPAP